MSHLSLLQWRMEEQRLKANGEFKTGNLPAAVDLYLSACKLFESHHTKPNNEELLALTTAGDSSAAAAPPASLATSASPAAIRSALLEELTKSVGNACTSLYKLGRFQECASVAKRMGIDRNPYFAKGHAFVGMSNINLLKGIFSLLSSSSSVHLLRAPLSAEERILTSQRLHEACQRLFIAMLILPAMAGQVKASLAEGLRYLKALKKEEQVGATSVVSSEDLIETTKSTGGQGLGVLAKKDLAAGTLLARLSHAFSVAPYDGFYRHVCVACGVPVAADEDEEKDEVSQAAASPTSDEKPKKDGKKKPLGCSACRRIRYCSLECQKRYHVPRHLLHECAYMLKLKVMCENIAERELDVPDEFAELATHTITTLSGLMVLKSNPLAFFDETDKELAEEAAKQADSNKNKSEEDTIITKAYKIRKSVLGLESHSVEVAQSMHPTLPLLCEVFSVDTMGDRGAVSTLSSPPTTPVSNNPTLPELDEHLIATLIGIVRCNSMEIADPSGLGVAQGLFAVPPSYLGLFKNGRAKGLAAVFEGSAAESSSKQQAIPLTACHFNHSCDPNAAFDVKAQEIRCIAPITAGTQVTISYIPQLYWPSNLRTEGLAERFYFNCSCDRCAPYRRAAVAEQQRKEKAKLAGSENAASLSDVLSLLTFTAEDVEVSSIYDKISAAEKPIAATERPGATRYYYNNMLGICGGIRQRSVEEIVAAQTDTTREVEAGDGSVTTTTTTSSAPTSSAAVSSETNPFVNEVSSLARQCSAHLEPWHYVLHDVHNTQTFLYSVLGDHGNALVSSMEELLTFEACVSSALPAKVDKLRNILACREGLKEKVEARSGNDGSASVEAFVAEEIISKSSSAHKDVLAMLWSDECAILKLLLEVYGTTQ